MEWEKTLSCCIYQNRIGRKHNTDVALVARLLSSRSVTTLIFTFSWSLSASAVACVFKFERSPVRSGVSATRPARSLTVPLADADSSVDETNAHHHPRFIRRIFRLRE